MSAVPRIVFFDFDGVLNAGNAPGEPTPGITNSRGSPLHLAALLVRNLAALLQATGAVGVISSSWRNHGTLAAFQAALAAHGLAHPLNGCIPNVGATPGGFSCSESIRSFEIMAWLDQNGMTTASSGWIALDDWDMARWLGDRLIRTSSTTGLDAKALDRAVARLQDAA